MKYAIKLIEQPWYHTYHLIQQIIKQRSARGTLVGYFRKDFNKEFKKWTEQVARGEKTTEELGDWLMIKHKEIQDRSSGKQQGTKPITKPKTTASGFERKSRWELTEDERASIMIDELIALFVPHAPDEFNLDIEKYKEDWKQELWMWCWSYKDRDPNLKELISRYNQLPLDTYKFHTSNFLSRMNSYIVPYIVKLQYSCNDMARYRLNNKYREEVCFPADDLSEIPSDLMDPIDLQSQIIDPEETLIEKETQETVKSLVEDLDKNETWYEDSSLVRKPSYIRYKKVLQMRYGLNSENHVYTLKETGDYLGVTRERVRQMEAWILRNIRNRIKNKKLKL